MVHHRSRQKENADQSPPEDGWQRVSHRSKGSKPFFNRFAVDASVITFFVSNIPEPCSSNCLWRLFEGFEDICDSFVSKRRDKQRCFFGFVKFKQVKDPYAMEASMKLVKWNDAILYVNLARFDRNGNPINYQRSATADAQPHPQTAKVAPFGQNSVSSFKPGFSFKDACIGVQAGHSFVKSISIQDKSFLYPQSCVTRSAIADVSSPESLRILKPLLTKEGFDNFIISYLGGLKVLIIFKDKHVVEIFLAKESLWRQHIKSASIWDGQEVDYERLAHLRIRGVPILLKDSSVLDHIGKSLGIQFFQSEFSWAYDDVSEGRCLAILNSGKRFEEELVLNWRSRSFKIWVVEVEEHGRNFLSGDIFTGSLEKSNQQRDMERSVEISNEESEPHGNSQQRDMERSVEISNEEHKPHGRSLDSSQMEKVPANFQVEQLNNTYVQQVNQLQREADKNQRGGNNIALHGIAGEGNEEREELDAFATNENIEGHIPKNGINMETVNGDPFDIDRFINHDLENEAQHVSHGSGNSVEVDVGLTLPRIDLENGASVPDLNHSYHSTLSGNSDQSIANEVDAEFEIESFISPIGDNSSDQPTQPRPMQAEKVQINKKGQKKGSKKATKKKNDINWTSFIGGISSPEEHGSGAATRTTNKSAIELETQETVRVGELIGINLKGYEDQIQALIREEGVNPFLV